MSKHSSNQGYETKDTTFKPVFLGIVVIFAVTAIGLIISAIFYSSLEKSWTKSQGKSSGHQSIEKKVVPSPQLETVPMKDYKTFKAEQERVLTTYGWVDPAKNKIHVPIEVAMKNALKKGFTVREKKSAEVEVINVPLESGGMKKV